MDWQVLVPKIITTITNFFASQQPILLKPSAIGTGIFRESGAKGLVHRDIFNLI